LIVFGSLIRLRSPAPAMSVGVTRPARRENVAGALVI
jgi:hypothetical protein